MTILKRLVTRNPFLAVMLAVLSLVFGASNYMFFLGAQSMDRLAREAISGAERGIAGAEAELHLECDREQFSGRLSIIEGARVYLEQASKLYKQAGSLLPMVEYNNLYWTTRIALHAGDIARSAKCGSS